MLLTVHKKTARFKSFDITNMDYNKQAEDFLLETETTLQIEKATEQKSPL